jgi:hypothetical protein
MLTRSVPKEIPTRTGDLAGIQVQKAARPERHGTGLVCQRGCKKSGCQKDDVCFRALRVSSIMDGDERSHLRALATVRGNDGLVAVLADSTARFPPPL